MWQAVALLQSIKYEIEPFHPSVLDTDSSPFEFGYVYSANKDLCQ